jgi:O-antigen ligase
MLPLATWPGLAAPFSTPKRWLLAGAVTLLLPLAVWHRRARRSDGGSAPVPPVLQFALVAWLISLAWSALAAPIVSPDALLLGIAGPLWCLVIVLAPEHLGRVVAAHVAGASVVAVVAIGQAAGVDPFAWVGWLPVMDGDSPRMRVYGTLGNPNFVAALMAMTLPLAAALVAGQAGWSRARTAAACVCALMIAALAVTGSRAGAIGLACGAVVGAGCLGGRASRWMMAAAVLVAASVIALSGGRGLSETLRGRAYIWQTTWSHAWEHPLTGLGPGAFELHYLGWEKAARASGLADARHTQFAGPQQFAHNDFLQALAERGVAGLATTVFVLAMPVLFWRLARLSPTASRAMLAGAAGAVAACAAIACLDFPLQRPAETATLWMAVALGWQAAGSTSPPLRNQET